MRKPKSTHIMPFAVGDVVILRSGGPAMTVSQVVPDDDRVVCGWFPADYIPIEGGESGFQEVYPEDMKVVSFPSGVLDLLSAKTGLADKIRELQALLDAGAEDQQEVQRG